MDKLKHCPPWWAHKILPLVYDDSLSYYEVLCKLTHYVNALITRTDELSDLYTELKDYVDHYFDNLNVQTEINNKLDQMVSDGTMAQIIAQFFQMYVTPEEYGAKGDGVTDDTEAIQNAIDSGLNVLFSKATYVVSKGSDPDNYPNGDEPCLSIIGATGQTIDGNGAILKVNAHGQGILEIKDSDYITIKDLHLSGYGSFPKLDINSGFAEKGAASLGGYYNTATNYEFGQFKNNSVDTSRYHGFGSNPDEVWGTFGNGYIGNCGSGILIYSNANNVTIDNCKIEGFNYCGVEIGTRTQGNQDTSRNVKVINCDIWNCYNAGVFVQGVTDANITNNNIRRIGHPDAFPNNYVYQYTYADPGYGISVTYIPDSGSYIVPTNVIISGNIIRDMIRKGIDMHTGAICLINNNIIENTYGYGIQCEQINSASGYLKDVIISNNLLRRAGQKGDCINVVSSLETMPARNITICDNVMEYLNLTGIGSPIYVRYMPCSVITGNSANASNARYGIVLVASPDSVVSDNRMQLDTLGDYLLYINVCDRICAKGNMLYAHHNTKTYYLEQCNGANISDNIFWNDVNVKTISNVNGLLYNNLIYNEGGTLLTGDSTNNFGAIAQQLEMTNAGTFTPTADYIGVINIRPATNSAASAQIQEASTSLIFSVISSAGSRSTGTIILKKGETYTFTLTNLASAYLILYPKAPLA